MPGINADSALQILSRLGDAGSPMAATCAFTASSSRRRIPLAARRGFSVSAPLYGPLTTMLFSACKICVRLHILCALEISNRLQIVVLT